MVLENFLRDVDILWDRVGKSLHERPDALVGRKMRVQVVNASIVEDLTGYALNLGWKSMSDETKFGLDAFTVIDATKGIFELEYTSGMLSNYGSLRGTLQLVPPVGNTVESNNFGITVKKSAIDSEAIQSETSFTALTMALVSVQNLETTYTPRLLSVEQQLEQTNVLSAEAVAKADAMASGSPKGVYATLALLQAAYPTGSTGAYLVTADGKWYYWSGSAWTIGGIYQSTGLADKSVMSNHISAAATTATVDNIYTRKHLNFSSARKKFDFTFQGVEITDGTCQIITYLKSENITGTTQATISPLFTVDGVTTTATSSLLTISDGVYKQESNYTLSNGTKNLVYSPYPYINLLGKTSIDLSVEIEVYILINGVKIYPSEVTDTTNTTNIIILNKWRENKILNYGDFDSVISDKQIITTNTSDYIEFDDLKTDTVTAQDKNEYVFQVKNHTAAQATLTLDFGTVNIASESITVTTTIKSDNVTGGQTSLGGALSIDGAPVSPVSSSSSLVNGIYTSIRTYPITIGIHTIKCSLMPYVDLKGEPSITLNAVGTCKISDSVKVIYPITRTTLNDPLKTIVYNRFSDNQIVSAGKFKQLLTDNDYVIDNQILSLKSRWYGKKWIAVGDSITEMYRGNTLGYTKTIYGDNYQGIIGKKNKIEILNKGISGRGYTSPSGDGINNGSFLDMLKTLEPNSCDLITIFGGVNDFQLPFLQMGSFDDMVTDTFYSRIRKTVEYVITNFPDAAFALFTPLPAAFSHGNNAAEVSAGRSLKTIADMIIEVGNHYSVPVLDLFRNSGMYPWDEFYANKYFRKEYLEVSDGLHPNMLGHKIIANKIEAFINTL